MKTLKQVLTETPLIVDKHRETLKFKVCSEDEDEDEYFFEQYETIELKEIKNEK